MTAAAQTNSETITPRHWLCRLEEACNRSGDAHDPEAVHLLRVASRRLDVWLRLGGLFVLRDDLRQLRHAASGVRDLDVLLEDHTLPPRAASWLRGLRETRAQDLSETLQSERFEALCAAFRHVLPISLSSAARRADKLLSQALDAGVLLEAHPERIASFHQLRRRVRSYRYAVEWLGGTSRSAEKMQEELGSLNDVDVALALLRGAPEAEASIATLETRLADCMKRASDAWYSFRFELRSERGTWNSP